MSEHLREWVDLELGQLGLVVTGRTPPKAEPELFGDQYPFYTPSDMSFGDRSPMTERFISDAGAQRFSRIMLPAGSTCFVCIGATIGKICLTSRPSFTNQQLNSIIPDQANHDPDFVYYLAVSIADNIKRLASGAATPIINKSSFSAFKVKVPPLPTQQRIASILTAYDDLIENNTRRIVILEEMARRLYEEWFVKGRPKTGETAVDWSWTTLGEICEAGGGSIQTGPFGSQLHQRDYQSTGTPVVMPKNIREGRIVADECARVSEENTNRLSKHKLDAFDIVFGRRGEIGRKALVRPHEAGALCGTGCLKVALGSPEVSPFYISEFLSEEQVVADLAGRAIGATMPNLNTSILAETKIARPPKQTVERYHELASASDEMTTVLHRENANLRAQRDLQLPKLVSGEIDVSEAEKALEAAE